MEPSDKQIEQEIERLEMQEAAASLRNDLDLIEKLWSDKLIVSGTSNLLFTKSQLLAFFRAGLIRMKSLERRITRVVIDRDTAVTTGSDTLLPAVGIDSGKTVYCSYMNCWNREDGEWKLLGRQVTVVGKVASDGTFERPGT
jgi:hypothetical protein